MPPDVPRNSLLPQSLSQGWKVDDAHGLLFVGGQISADRDGVVVGAGDIEAQTRNVFMNIGRVLRDGGAAWSDVVRMDAYYLLEGDTDAGAYWRVVSAVSSEFLPDPGPAWTAVRVPGLAYPGLLIEIDAIVAVGA
jgi:enamine deaminase RidA (YjgF/YER057c/UK114 family)